MNVNEAGQDELDAIEGLHGHGFEIIRYRDERRRFDSLRQLDEMPAYSSARKGVLPSA